MCYWEAERIITVEILSVAFKIWSQMSLNIGLGMLGTIQDPDKEGAVPWCMR